MLFKTYGYISVYQALQFVADMKLGHYMKIPPRQMFWAQVVATVLGGTAQLGVQSWMYSVGFAYLTQYRSVPQSIWSRILKAYAILTKKMGSRAHRYKSLEQLL